MTRRNSIVLMVGALFGIAVLHTSGLLRPAEDAGRWALLPFARALGRVGHAVGSVLRPSEGRAALEERVRDLEAHLAAVSIDAVKLRAFEEENESLRRLAKFLVAGGYDHVPAQIISRASNTRRSAILFDRGAQDGLETGMAVIANDGIFVGKITSIRERVSVVSLLADSQSRVSAARSGAPGLIGLVQGEGNGVARLDLVPHSVSLGINDLIETAGTEDKIPPHLAMGIVNHVDGAPTDPFLSASLEPLADVSRISVVAVLRPSALRPTREGLSQK